MEEKRLPDVCQVTTLLSPFQWRTIVPNYAKYQIPNHEKCKIAGIGVLKSVKVAVGGMKYIDLWMKYIDINTIKITGTHFSYNRKKRKEKKYLESITKIKNVLEF